MKKIILIFCLPFLTSCSIRYLAHVTKGQIQLMTSRQNIQEAIDEQKFTPEEVQKLSLVLDVRQFGIDTLGLEKTKSYEKVVQLNRPYVAYNIVVCPKDKLEPVSWSFPFAGSVAYLGFFDLDYAKEYQKDYEAENYDVYLRGVSAYSTLGWFDDPLFSSMLQYREDTLANLILHEMAHATVYVGGNTEFNEGMATFIGNQGALDYFEKKHGKNSKFYKNARASQEDEILFSGFIQKAKQKLTQFYTLTSKDMVLQKRKQVFQDIQREFKEEISPKLKISYQGFLDLPLNNAVMVGLGQYVSQLDLFQKIWLKNGKNLKKMILYLKDSASTENNNRAQSNVNNR